MLHVHDRRLEHIADYNSLLNGFHKDNGAVFAEEVTCSDPDPTGTTQYADFI
jgi:hypothetical protein